MTTFAYFDGGVFIGEYDEAELPVSAQRQDTRAWISRLLDADPADQRAAGYYKVTPIEQPPDTDTLTYDRGLLMDPGDPQYLWETWTPRPKTDDERTADNADKLEHDTTINIDAIRQAADAMRTILRAGNPTINAGPAPYIKVIARDCLDTMHQVIRLARLITHTTDTATIDTGTGTATTTHEWMIVL